MYYSHRSSAYDFALFEEPVVDGTSARARQKVEETFAEKPVKKNETAEEKSAARKAKAKRAKRRRRSRRFGRIVLGVVFGFAVLFIIASIIHGQVQLTEINQEIIDARADLSEKQSIYTQLEMKVDSSISTAVVEQYAQDNLKMSKASNSQKEFISLSQGDKAEVTLTENKNIFEQIGDLIASLWS